MTPLEFKPLDPNALAILQATRRRRDCPGPSSEAATNE
jgi:hypothetical protein